MNTIYLLNSILLFISLNGYSQEWLLTNPTFFTETQLQAQNEVKIYNVGHGYFNVFLVAVNGKFIMIDSGIAGKEKKVIKNLKKLGIAPSQINLLLITHAHGDHSGGAAYFQRHYGVTVLIHKKEVAVAEKGEIDDLIIGTPKKKLAEWVKKRAHYKFQAFSPDIVIDDNTSTLKAYGFPGEIIYAGGHTAGSIFYSIGDTIFIGDLLRGKLLPFFRKKPAYHFFADDLEKVYLTLSELVEKEYQTYMVGHGGPLKKKDVKKFLKIYPI